MGKFKGGEICQRALPNGKCRNRMITNWMETGGQTYCKKGCVKVSKNKKCPFGYKKRYLKNSSKCCKGWLKSKKPKVESLGPKVKMSQGYHYADVKISPYYELSFDVKFFTWLAEDGNYGWRSMIHIGDNYLRRFPVVWFVGEPNLTDLHIMNTPCAPNNGSQQDGFWSLSTQNLLTLNTKHNFIVRVVKINDEDRLEVFIDGQQIGTMAINFVCDPVAQGLADESGSWTQPLYTGGPENAPANGEIENIRYSPIFY